MASFSRGGVPEIGIVDGDCIAPISTLMGKPPRNMQFLIRRWPVLKNQFKIAERIAIPLSTVKLLPPIQHPQKIMLSDSITRITSPRPVLVSRSISYGFANTATVSMGRLMLQQFRKYPLRSTMKSDSLRSSVSAADAYRSRTLLHRFSVFVSITMSRFATGNVRRRNGCWESLSILMRR